MISRVSSILVGWLLKARAIPQDDKDLYEYAAYSLLFSLSPLCLVMFIGGIMGMFLEGILMVLPFMLIRKFSGGVHLRSPLLCFISSTLLLSLSLAAVRLVSSGSRPQLFFCAVVPAALQIFLLSPFDSETRRLNEKEFALFRKIARLMSLLFLAITALLFALGRAGAAVPMGTGIIITALLQLPCLFRKKSP